MFEKTFQRRVKRNSKARLREVKEKARLIFVTVGKNLDMDALYQWASFPPEYNILTSKGSCVFLARPHLSALTRCHLPPVFILASN